MNRCACGKSLAQTHHKAKMCRECYNEDRTGNTVACQNMILWLRWHGNNLKEIAAMLHCSLKTVEFYWNGLGKRAGTSDQSSICKWGLRVGLIHFCLMLCLSAQAQFTPLLVHPAVVAKPQPTVHAQWVWDSDAVAEGFIFNLRSNGVTIASYTTKNPNLVLSNLIAGVDYSVALQATNAQLSNSYPAYWFITNYAQVLGFSTNIGSWVPLTNNLFVNPTSRGFITWSNFNNFPASRD